jgi:hypothetical protein
MIQLRWDPIAAKTAYNYLVNQGCAGGFQHNANRSYDYWNNGGRNGATSSNSASNPVYVGENWYSNGPDNVTDPVFGGATKMWTNGNCDAAEYSNGQWTCTDQKCSEMEYFYQTGVCYGTFDDYGHFTQVMWATTAWVGCGYTQECGTLCDYVVGGNYNLPPDPKPSDVWGCGGAAASNCPSGYEPQSNGLCAASSSTYNTTSTSNSTTSTTASPTTSPTSTPATTTSSTTTTSTPSSTPTATPTNS